MASPDWVKRRTETLNLAEHRQILREIVLDVDCAELIARARQHGLAKFDSLPIPIMHLPKGVPLEIEAFDVGRNEMTICTRDQDARLAQLSLLSSAESLDYPPDRWSYRVQQIPFWVADSMPSEHTRKALVSSDLCAGVLEHQGLIPDYRLLERERLEWDEIVWLAGGQASPSSFAELLYWYALNYVAVTEVRTTPSTTRITVRQGYDRYSGELVAFPKGAKETLGHMSVRAVVSGIGRAQRDHVRVVAPRETSITGIKLLRESREEGLVDLRSPVFYSRRINPAKSALYLRSATPGRYALEVGLRPSPEDFFVTALCAVGLMFGVTFLGALGELFGEHLQNVVESRTEPAVAILLGLPTLFSIFLVRQGESESKSDLLKVPRRLAVSSSIGTLLATISLLASPTHSSLLTAWSLASLVCLASLIYILVVYVLTARNAQEVARRSHETYTMVATTPLDIPNPRSPATDQ